MASASRPLERTSASSAATLPRRWPLIAWMLAAIAVVTGVAWLDEQREAESALRDLEMEQSTLAVSLAGVVRAHLASLDDAAQKPALRGASIDASAWLREARGVEQAGKLAVFVSAPHGAELDAMDGHPVASHSLATAIDRGATTWRLSRSEAAEVGLPARTAMAGLAYVDAGDRGHWSVVAVASAAQERDREKRAQMRLVSGVLMASALVLAFGGAALRRQRKELKLVHELEVTRARRERDEELARAERMATMGTFAMGVAHEVSTPLGVIFGRTEQLLARVRGDERATRGAETILRQAERIQQIVRRFLDMARGGHPTLERVDPSEVVRAATTAVEHRFAHAQVTLGSAVAEKIPAVSCDRALLEHALVNLLLNACEACRAGGHVVVTANTATKRVVFVVTDDGVGISVEHAKRATEPFFTTKAAGTGTGLGLAIAAEIVKSHHGALTLAPLEGRGTRVHRHPGHRRGERGDGITLTAAVRGVAVRSDRLFPFEVAALIERHHPVNHGRAWRDNPTFLAYVVTALAPQPESAVSMGIQRGSAGANEDGHQSRGRVAVRRAAGRGRSAGGRACVAGASQRGGDDLPFSRPWPRLRALGRLAGRRPSHLRLLPGIAAPALLLLSARHAALAHHRLRSERSGHDRPSSPLVIGRIV